jgi:hypothetical protein
MVLPNPASPPTTDPETSASRTMTKLLSSAHPSHQAVKDTGGVPDKSIRATATRGSRYKPRSRIRPGPSCSARMVTQPQVSAREVAACW